MSTRSYLEMSSDSTHEGKVPHYAYLMLRIVPSFSTKIALLGLLNEPLFLIEVAASFSNVLIRGCVLFHYYD